MSSRTALAALLAVRGRSGELRAALGAGRRGRVVLAGLAAGGYQIAFFSAVAATGVTLGTVVALGVASVATGICARLLLGEELGRRWAGATALAVAGCTVMVLAAGGEGGATSLAGVALAVAAGACYGLYTTAAKALLDDGLAHLPALTATLGLGAALTLPVLLAGRAPRPRSPARRRHPAGRARPGGPTRTAHPRRCGGPRRHRGRAAVGVGFGSAAGRSLLHQPGAEQAVAYVLSPSSTAWKIGST